VSRISTGVNKEGHGYTIFSGRCLRQMTEVAGPYLKDGKKHIGERIMDDIDDFGVAIWYFDDGSIDPPRRTRNGNVRDAMIRIATFSFSEEEVDFLKEVLVRRFGVRPATFVSRNKYLGIRLSGDDVRTFVSKIRQIPGIEKAGMNYKIPEDLEVFWKRCKPSAALKARVNSVFGTENQSQAARKSGLSRKTVWRMLKKEDPWSKSGPSEARLKKMEELFGTRNQSEASRRLGIDRKTIWQTLKEHGV